MNQVPPEMLAVPARVLLETRPPEGDLDPDIAQWRAVILSIWPFTGAPSAGTWPMGWLGIDNTSALWVCTAGGTPGTWAEIGGAATGYASLTGPGETATPGDLTQAGGFTVDDTAGDGITLLMSGATSHNILTIAQEGLGGIEIFDTGGGGILMESTGQIALTPQGEILLTSETSAIDITANGTLTLANGAVGQLIINNSGALSMSSTGQMTLQNVPWPMTHAQGHLASDYTLTTSLATFLTTASLAIGTWLVHLGGFADQLVAANTIDIEVNAGTATATFEGQSSTTTENVGGEASSPFSLDFIATVTAAGTLVFQAIESSATNNSTIKATSGLSGFARATGYTAVRIA